MALYNLISYNVSANDENDGTSSVKTRSFEREDELIQAFIKELVGRMNSYETEDHFTYNAFRLDCEMYEIAFSEFYSLSQHLQLAILNYFISCKITESGTGHHLQLNPLLFMKVNHDRHEAGAVTIMVQSSVPLKFDLKINSELEEQVEKFLKAHFISENAYLSRGH